MKEKETKWREGVSKTSVGRFGGYGKEYTANVRGLLCMNGTADTLSLFNGKNGEFVIGRLKFESDILAEPEADWTTVKYTIKGGKKKLEEKGIVYQSLLSPGVLYEMKGNTFCWQYDRDYQLMKCAFPLKKGLVIRNSNYSYSVKRDGELSAPWMLAFSNNAYTNDLPLLFVFHNKLEEINCTNDDFKKFIFSGKLCRVVIMPLFGIRKFQRDDIKRWENVFPDDIRKKCEFWAQAMQAYPVKCTEEYRVDKVKDIVSLKNTFEYLESKEHAAQKIYLAPVPPVVNQAKIYGYPVQFEEKVYSLDIPTKMGMYSASYSNSVTYHMPRTYYIDETILPVRVSGDDKFKDLVKNLAGYLEDPALTFGGDETYTKYNIQDVLHNLRILGWATWSFDTKKREELAKKLTKKLTEMTESNYDAVVEPVSGGKFLKEKNIWAVNGGEASYDYEWYNGMQLSGLWAYYYFCRDKGAVSFLKKKWKIIEGLADYFRVYCDWETGTFPTDAIGEHLWMDGFNYGWQGLIALARLAGAVDNRETGDEAEYLVAKSTLIRWATWYLSEYVSRNVESLAYFWPNLDRNHLKFDYAVTGFTARKGLSLQNFYAQGGLISYWVPELFQLYFDDPSIIKKLGAGQYNQLTRKFPDWTKHFDGSHNYFRQKGIEPDLIPKEYFENQQKAWHHFYFLDPLLIVRAIVLRESWDRLNAYVTELTGPVMEAYLVGTHPIVIFPVNLEFCGNEWDEKNKTLTVKYKSDEKRLARIKVITRQIPKEFTGITEHSYDGRREIFIGKFEAKPEGKIVLKF